MKILIIEDEEPASERLSGMLHEFDPSMVILGTLRGVRESIAWLDSHPAPDLILADIQLNDGMSFDIFKKKATTAPIIFTTAFDEYLIKAFEYNSIDYIVKPIKKEKLFHALTKYINLKQHILGNIETLLHHIDSAGKPDRIVVQKGTDFIALKMGDIAYFYTEHKIVFLMDKHAKRYILDKSLMDVENLLDPRRFYRLNRKFIAQIDAIVKFRSHDKGKLLVDLIPAMAEQIIVSQENATSFKEWMGK